MMSDLMILFATDSPPGELSGGKSSICRAVYEGLSALCDCRRIYAEPSQISTWVHLVSTRMRWLKTPGKYFYFSESRPAEFASRAEAPSVGEMIEKIFYYQAHPDELRQLTARGSAAVHARALDYDSIISGLLRSMGVEKC